MSPENKKKYIFIIIIVSCIIGTIIYFSFFHKKNETDVVDELLDVHNKFMGQINTKNEVNTNIDETNRLIKETSYSISHYHYMKQYVQNQIDNIKIQLLMDKSVDKNVFYKNLSRRQKQLNEINIEIDNLNKNLQDLKKNKPNLDNIEIIQPEKMIISESDLAKLKKNNKGFNILDSGRCLSDIINSESKKHCITNSPDSKNKYQLCLDGDKDDQKYLKLLLEENTKQPEEKWHLNNINDFCMESTGNLIAKSKNETILWETQTETPDSYLKLLNNGSLMLYGPDRSLIKDVFTELPERL